MDNLKIKAEELKRETDELIDKFVKSYFDKDALACMDVEAMEGIQAIMKLTDHFMDFTVEASEMMDCYEKNLLDMNKKMDKIIEKLGGRNSKE